jgi:hypothetical protein
VHLNSIANRKSYDPPAIRTLEFNQGVLLLVGHAYIGDAGAKYLLELLFPEASVLEGSGAAQD